MLRTSLSLVRSRRERNLISSSSYIMSKIDYWTMVVNNSPSFSIQDEPKVANFVSRGLTAERFAVDVAKDGNSGLEFSRSYEIDLIILDLMLPIIDGSEILRKRFVAGTPTYQFSFSAPGGLLRIRCTISRQEPTTT